MKQQHDEVLINLLRMTAPGTDLREGLDHVLRANSGGLIVIAEEEKLDVLGVGGFDINAPYTPAHLYELAKMDGAILITADIGRIMRANVHLNPNPSIPSSETGIRHRTAEQTARENSVLVISISQRRRLITLFKGNTRYVLRETNALLNMANLAVETLEKYKNVLGEAQLRLSLQEFDGAANLEDVLTVVQRAEMFKRVEQELHLYITELGQESRLIKMQADELSSNVDAEERLTIKDYMLFSADRDVEEQIDQAVARLRRLENEDLLDMERLANILGYDGFSGKKKRNTLSSRGYRLLHKIPRLPASVIANLVEDFGTLSNLISATMERLDEVEGVGPARAQQITTGLERLRAQIMVERHWT